VKTEPFYVAIITPVIHYCMGGLEIDVNSAVVGKSGKPIAGLYAAGEVAGGVHGNNRLGGNSLLDCVVFGRVAGKHCARYMLGGKIQETSLAKLSGEVGNDASVAAGASSKTQLLPGPTKDPTKAAHYKGEKWRGHLREKSMGFWLKQQEKKKRLADAKAEEAAARALEEGPPVPEWQKRERQCLDQHYFPLKSEQGQENVLPWFRETRASAHVQVCRWLQDAWAATSDTGKRKCALISSVLILTVIVTEVIKATPHE